MNSETVINWNTHTHTHTQTHTHIEMQTDRQVERQPYSGKCCRSGDVMGGVFWLADRFRHCLYKLSTTSHSSRRTLEHIPRAVSACLSPPLSLCLPVSLSLTLCLSASLALISSLTISKGRLWHNYHLVVCECFIIINMY